MRVEIVKKEADMPCIAFQPEELLQRGNFMVSVGIETTDWFTVKNCWKVNLLAELAEVIPAII